MGWGASVFENVVEANSVSGIVTDQNSFVRGNTLYVNLNAASLRLGDNAAYQGNVINSAAGTVAVAQMGAVPVNLGANSCNGTATCA